MNPVNKDIQKSLASSNGPNFWWLNNGITIIGTAAHIIGNTITICDVQIVNGLQTSEAIYNYFSGRITESEIYSDARSVLIKILISSDKKTNDAIIYATNNQTNVNVTALRATDKIQMDIEAILKSNHIYYERKTNYYQNQGVPEQLIITPLSIAAGYICLIYKNPYIAASLKQKFMRNNAKYEKVFSSSVDVNVWVPIASLIMMTDQFLLELRYSVHGIQPGFLKNYRFIVLFITISRLMRSFAFDEKALINFDVSRYTKSEVLESIQDILEIDSTFFSHAKKPKAEAHTLVFHAIAEKHQINSIQAVQTKNRLLWSGIAQLEEFHLSEETLEQVQNALPAQPWPAKVHMKVAHELGISVNTVSDAIAFLIYSNKLHYQIDGYVFSETGDVIAEGEHYGRSLEGARKKLKETMNIHARKFGF